MILEFIIKFIIYLVVGVISIIFAPIRLIFPSIQFGDQFISFAGYFNQVLSTSVNLLSYFSSPSSVRILITLSIIYFFILPLVDLILLIPKLFVRLFGRLH